MLARGLEHEPCPGFTSLVQSTCKHEWVTGQAGEVGLVVPFVWVWWDSFLSRKRIWPKLWFWDLWGRGLREQANLEVTPTSQTPQEYLSWAAVQITSPVFIRWHCGSHRTSLSPLFKAWASSLDEEAGEVVTACFILHFPPLSWTSSISFFSPAT